ncbi:MAG: hypothetical protein E2O68_03925 [Deltaproteobacteria bacterium]|nr:MAG: hypothetical protein E2O68_03925 [Deltaproteobacteria bacterium]
MCEFSKKSFSHYSKFLNHYNICQDPGNDKIVRIQLEKGNDQVKYCFIPTYSQDGGDKSIFIGEPRCLLISDSRKIHEIEFLKNRPSPKGSLPFSKFPIKGVLIIKDEVLDFLAPFKAPLPAPNAYLKCAEVLDLTGDDSYCLAFKEMGRYSLHSF